jgi:arginine N-succinyltransferase
MNFVIRNARMEDLGQLYDLARQFTLLNLPSDKSMLGKKLEKSLASFQGELPKEDAEYMFVLEDIENNFVAGAAMILAKSGTPQSPNYSFKILKKERFSRELGVGFIHQILRLNVNTDGPTEFGGLVLDRGYRRRPEKLGRIMSLSRFCYVALFQDRFESEAHAELAPPLTEEGRSEFWESLGRRFTGMPYKEADQISSQNNQFIQSLFPEEDIYLCLLDSKARLVLGRVGEETQPALHLLTKIGFKLKDEVDPFDGGPHLGCAMRDISIIKKGRNLKAKKRDVPFRGLALSALWRDQEFRTVCSAYHVSGDEITLPDQAWSILELSEGESLFVSPIA